MQGQGLGDKPNPMGKKEAKTMNSITQDIMTSIRTANKRTHDILVTFGDGKQARYTISILEMLKAEPMVAEIMDLETGEILYWR